MIRIKHFAAALVASFSLAAFAGTPVLGVEVGTSTVAQVRDALPDPALASKNGINKYSNGPMLSVPGTAWDITGLQKVLFIFDQQEVLTGVLMTMNKSRFVPVFDAISAKYKLVKQRRPFVGDQYARFNAGDTVIELDAPHMSFEMTVTYLTKTFKRNYEETSAAEAKADKARQASQF